MSGLLPKLTLVTMNKSLDSPYVLLIKWFFLLQTDNKIIPGGECILGIQEVWEGFDGVKELNFRSASAVLIGEFVQRRCICPMHNGTLLF